MEKYEIVKPMFYDTAKLIKQPDIIYRSNFNTGRYYYKFKEDGTVQRAGSVTTIIDSEMKQEQWLIDWYIKYGKEKAYEIRDRAGHYGTFFGICASQYQIDNRFDFATLKPRIEVYKYSKGIDFNTDNWEFKAKEDLLALAHFIKDYEVTPIAIEIMLFSKLGFAGAIDIVVEMTVGTGMNGRILKTDRKLNKKTGEIEDKTKRIKAIIDWKSGRHGFSAGNEAQLHFYRLMWNENYPHFQVDAVFNWSPKNWDDDESSMYNLKEQSNSIQRKLILNYLENFKIKDKFGTQTFKEIDGIIEVGKELDNLHIYQFDDWVKKIHNKTAVIEKEQSLIESINEFIETENIQTNVDDSVVIDESITEPKPIVETDKKPIESNTFINEQIVQKAEMNTDKQFADSENLINNLQLMFQTKSNGVTNE